MEAELDDGRHETRKIEVFEDGRMVEVSQEKSELGPTGLAEESYPTGEVWRRADR